MVFGCARTASAKSHNYSVIDVLNKEDFKTIIAEDLPLMNRLKKQAFGYKDSRITFIKVMITLSSDNHT